MEGDLQRRLGRSIRARRKAVGVTQEKYAELLEVDRTYVGGLERGERNVTLRTVERFAKRMDADPVDLLRGPPEE